MTAWATSVLIGVTWLTTTTVLPACASSSRCSPSSTRFSTTRNDSPPPGDTSSDPSQASSSSLCCSATSMNVMPSQVPNSISANPGSTSTVLPSTSARISADSRVRRTGRRDHGVDLLGQRRQPVGGGPDLVAALVGQPRVGAGQAAGEPLLDRVRRDAVADQDQRGRRTARRRPAAVGLARRLGARGSRSPRSATVRRAPRRRRSPRSACRRAPRWRAGRRACSAPAAPRCTSSRRREPVAPPPPAAACRGA